LTVSPAPLEDRDRDRQPGDALRAGKKEYAKEAQAVADTGEDGLPAAVMAPADGVAAEAVIAM
jgi:hypothetical protein